MVGNAKVVERTKQPQSDAPVQVAAINEILLAECKEVPTVCSFGSRGEAQKELWLEMLDQPSV